MQLKEMHSTGHPFLSPEGGRCLINDIPVELLSHIFVLGAEEEEDEIDPEASDCESENDVDLAWELLITRVCRLWRDVAIQTAVLWTKIAFYDESPGPKQLTYLRRSQGAPLAIDIVNSADHEETKVASFSAGDPLSSLQSIFAVVAPHITRWRSFEMEVADYALMAYALDKFCQYPAAPLLERFRLYHNEEDDVDNTALQLAKLDSIKSSELGLFMGNVPLLKDVVLSGVPLIWSTCPFLPFLNTLELAYHADILRPSYTDFSRVICSTSKLSELRLCDSGPAGRLEDWGTSPLKFPNLKTLSLKYMDPASTEVLVSRMNMPQLVSLVLDFEADECNSLLRALSTPHPLMKHSVFSKLESLKLGGLQCSRAKIRTTYEALTKMRSLELNFSFLSPDWHTALTRSPMPCPLLGSLAVSGLEGSQLLNIISVRKKMGRPLKQLRVGGDRALVTKNHELWLRQNVHCFGFYQDSDEETDDESDDGWEVDSDDRMDDNYEMDTEFNHGSEGEGATEEEFKNGSDGMGAMEEESSDSSAGQYSDDPSYEDSDEAGSSGSGI